MVAAREFWRPIINDFNPVGPAAATPAVVVALLKSLTDSDERVRWAAAGALENLSVSVHPHDRSQAVKLFLPLTRSRDWESREAGYIGLRNLLAGSHDDAGR